MKTLAANAASAFPFANVSRKCSMHPAPPDAMTGIVSKSARVERASLAYPFFTPSWFMLVKRISPAPRLFTSLASQTGTCRFQSGRRSDSISTRFQSAWRQWLLHRPVNRNVWQSCLPNPDCGWLMIDRNFVSSCIQ